MAKRFTDTEKWKDPWFRDLGKKYKIVWLYLLDTCDHCGLWKADFKLLNFQLEEKFTKDDLENVFSDKITKVSDYLYWIPDFIGYQYCKITKLDESNRVHKSILEKIDELKLRVIDDPLMTHDRPIDGCKDKDKDKEKEKKGECEGKTKRRKASDNYSQEFIQLWSMYPRPEGKKDAYKEFLNSVITDQDKSDITIAIQNYIEKVQKDKTEYQFIKSGKTFFRDWKDYVNVRDVTLKSKRDVFAEHMRNQGMQQ